MPGRTAFVYHPAFEDRGLSPFPSVWRRYRLTRDLVRERNLPVVEIAPEPAGRETLLLAHTARYVDFVRAASRAGFGFLDEGDTPAYPGVYERACASVGASVCGARLVAGGEFAHAFNPGGGLHHAKADSAGGFCVFNDIVVAVRILQREFRLSRIAILDIDGHHCDGTQEMLYREPLLKISLHRFGPGFFPGTGSAEETGEGDGEGYCLNIPLPEDTDSAAYRAAFHGRVPGAIRGYRPEIILMQCGVDGEKGDPLVGMSLSENTYREVAAAVHGLAHELCGGRLLLFGGGGYRPERVAACWTAILETVCEPRTP
ncbi:MAG: acetoin utilization protein AcuC [Deltaproteobacteria bacterium]|nr:acetoin utilization protein AcuC [Deltaproteobacteria bacterium]